MSRPRLVALVLALATLAVYLPVVGHGFILYDDGDYVTQNKMVQGGLTAAGIKWAFTSFEYANWHPLTWLSHMADCEMFGVNAAGSHFINALFHAVDTVLLFALWRQLTSRTGASDDSKAYSFWAAALVAALFALHPLHVESVAWAAERKDVLSAFFGLLALLAYARYAQSGRVAAAYWLALVFFACGLMSKPMLVTLPFVMLLLDYWPLQRLSAASIQKLLVEKIPFFALTVASCVVTYMAQSRGAVRSLSSVPLMYRLENVPVTVTGYLVKIFWPTHLAVIYPMPKTIVTEAWVVDLIALIIITAAVWQARKKYPFLPVGWFWFLGTLVPVIGLVKVGDAAMADRYTYLPSIGIFVMVAFGAEPFFKRLALPKYALPITAIVVLAALAAVTERQLSFWQDDEALFQHAMEVTTDNVDAIINYGVALEYVGKPMEALTQYQRAQRIAPDSYMACVDLGNLYNYMGKPEDALGQYQRAVQLQPNLRTVRDGLGSILAGLGHFSEATNEFYAAMRLDPASATPHLYLGIALAAHNDLTDATNEFAQAISLAPGDPTPLVEWGRALLEQGRDIEGIDELHAALQLDPNNFETLAFLAHVLAADEQPGMRDGASALTYAQQASALTGAQQPLVQDVLGMAYAESGEFDEAQNTASNAVSLATAAGVKPATVADMQKRWQLYQAHQAWRESFLNSTN